MHIVPSLGKRMVQDAARSNPGWVVVVAMLFCLDAALAEPFAAVHFNEPWRWVTFNTASGLPSNQVSRITESRDGVLWVETNEGLAWYDGFHWNVVIPGAVDAFVPDHDAGLLAIQQQRLYRVSQQGFLLVPLLWRGAPLDVIAAVPYQDDGLLVLSDGGLFHMSASGRGASPVGGLGGYPDAVVEDLKVTRSGKVWALTNQGTFREGNDGWQPWCPQKTVLLAENSHLGLYARGSSSLNYGVWRWEGGAEEAQPERVRPEELSVETLDVGPEGNALVVYGNGVVEIWDGQSWTSVSEVPQPLKFARQVYFDRRGDLWVVNDLGLYLYRATSSRWSQFAANTGRVNVANEIVEDSNGNIWVAQHDGLHRFSPGRPPHTIRTIQGVQVAELTALVEDREGGIWVGSGAGRFTGAFRWYQDRWSAIGPGQGLPAFAIHKIRKDRHGDLWLLGLGVTPGAASQQPGAYRWDGERFERWGEAEGLPSGRVYDFAEGPDGARWFATNQGVARWADGAWQYWTEAEGLRHHRVFTLAADPRGGIWFGHQGFGLGRIDAQGNVGYLDVQDGLLDNNVWGMAFGPDSTLWITTEGGLNSLANGIISPFGPASGLVRPRTWPVLPQEDRVLVGTVGGGVAVLHLEEASFPPPAVRVRRPVVDGEGVHYHWSAQAYRGNQPPGSIETRYRLNDGPWSAWSKTREVSQLGVPAGEHAFAVQAKGLFGQVSAGGVSLFVIDPPFYSQPLFIGVVLTWAVSLSLLGLVYLHRQRRYHAALREREEHFRTLIENGSDLITVLSPTGLIEYVSPSIERVLGYVPGHMEDSFLESLVHTDDRQVWERLLDDAQGEVPPPLTLRLLHNQGVWRTFEVVSRRHRQADGSLTTILNARDITERQQAEQDLRTLNVQLEQRVTDRTAALASLNEALAGANDELAAANHDLESFSYSVSHDLRAPLRAINGFAEIMVSRYAGKLDDSGRHFLDNILEAGTQMDQLIKDLLAYSRLGRTALQRQTVSLDEVLDAVCKTLAPRIEALDAEIRRPQHLPVIESNHTLLKQIFLNLIDNALAYRRPEVTPAVTITCGQLPDGVVIHVADNGVGIPERHREKVFRVFQRLHGNEVNPGTGIGLAIVKKSVVSLGGEIGLDSKVGKGSTFSIRLPHAVAGEP